eukprot:Em0002g1696a
MRAGPDQGEVHPTAKMEGLGEDRLMARLDANPENMDNQPPPQQAVAVVMDNCGCSYSGITNTFTSGGKLVDVPNQIPSVIQHCSFVVCGRRWWVWGGGDDEYGEEMMLWGGDDDLELVKQLQLVGDELLEIDGNSTEGMGHADANTIKHEGDIVKLTMRRLPESLSGLKPNIGIVNRRKNIGYKRRGTIAMTTCKVYAQ